MCSRLVCVCDGVYAYVVCTCVCVHSFVVRMHVHTDIYTHHTWTHTRVLFTHSHTHTHTRVLFSHTDHTYTHTRVQAGRDRPASLSDIVRAVLGRYGSGDVSTHTVQVEIAQSYTCVCRFLEIRRTELLVRRVTHTHTHTQSCT